ncbi:MAG: hypothetical protein NVS3B20_17210 [Polyangiales bacterium]
MAMVGLIGCSSADNGISAEGASELSASTSLSRDEFNRRAIRLNLPLAWAEDANHDGAVQPNEIVSLLFFSEEGRWTKDGKFTPEYQEAHAKIGRDSGVIPRGLSSTEQARRELVSKNFDKLDPNIISTDFTGVPSEEKVFIRHMWNASKLVDDLFERQRGVAQLRHQVPLDDHASLSSFNASLKPSCLIGDDQKCSAIPSAPALVSDLYPADLQTQPKFCETLRAREDGKQLLDQFSVVRRTPEGLMAVPYAKAYAEEMGSVANELEAASRALDSSEGPTRDYLMAAAAAFRNNDWYRADEAWVKINSANSKWYVRVAPDEVYYDPCGAKAYFHVAFARSSDGAAKWKARLAPLKVEMERTVAAFAGAPYAARNVGFGLPEFIDIVWNAGFDRSYAILGESLPNFGPSTAHGRTMTVDNIETGLVGMAELSLKTA